jgi:hypothetical protein
MSSDFGIMLLISVCSAISAIMAGWLIVATVVYWLS